MSRFLSVALALALTAVSYGAKESTIKIGHVDAMSGADAVYGKAADNGIQLAFREINQRGGLLGKQLELITLDDASKSSEAVDAVTKLITMHQVVAILGESTSSKALAMAPIAQDSKTPMISPWATNVDVTKVGNFIFRVCYVDSFQGMVLAKYVKDELKIGSVALLNDAKSAASIGIGQFFAEEFKKRGGKITSTETYYAGDVDFRPQILSAMRAKPEALFLSGYYTEAGLIARQAREVGFKGILFGADALDSPALLKVAGNAFDGGFFSNHYAPDNQSPLAVAFNKSYKAAFGDVPNAAAALGYDAAQVLAEAIGKAKSVDREAIRKALEGTKNFPGVTGTISFDANRNAVKPVVMVGIEKGGFKFRKAIAP